MIKRKNRMSRSVAKKAKIETLSVWYSYQNANEEWRKARVGSAWVKSDGRLSIALTPLASWIGGDPEVNLTVFLEPYDGSSDSEEEEDE